SNNQGNKAIDVEDDQPTADMLQMYARAYPFRKRLERNLHPYTKLVWTDPSELLSSRNSCRDPLVLEESQAGTNNAKRASQAYMDANIDDLDDEDYIPGSPDEFADGGTQPATESMDIDIGSLSFRSPRKRNGVTYRHLASRQRHRLRGTPRKRPRYEQRVANLLSNQPGQDGYASDSADIDPDQLPSISSLLGSRNGGISSCSSVPGNHQPDPFDVPLSGDLRIHNQLGRLDHSSTAHNNEHQYHNQVQLYSDLSSSSLGEQPGVLADRSALSRISADNSSADHDNLDDALDTQLSKGVSRQDSKDAAPGRYSSSSNEPGRLLKAKKKTPRNLLRHQIRGVLPFSFMRDVSMDNPNESDSALRANNWHSYSERNISRRRVLTSSSSDNNSDNGSETGSLHTGIMLDNSGHVSFRDYSGAENIAEMFSDSVRSPPANRLSIRDDPQPIFGHSHFRFNFMDLYEWQYPPIAPIESIGHAPDFLRIAARECRRRGIRAKSTHDDPFRKRITIEPRTEKESKCDDDVAQSILMSWKLGVIDVRRVYFCDDEYEQGDELTSSNGDVEMALGEFSDGRSAIEQQLDNLPSPIIVSDEEAIEDNRTYDTLARTRRHRQKSSSGNRDGTLKKARHRQQPRLTAGSRAPRSFFDLKKPSKNPRSKSVNQTTPLAQRLGSVMDEFAAFDSDSDTNMPDIATHDRPSLDSSRSIRERISEAQPSKDRQDSFISRFHRQRKPHHSTSNDHRNFSSRNHTVSGNRSKRPGYLRGTDNAIFIFDDDVGRPSSHDVYGRASFKQTKLISNKTLTSSFSSTRNVKSTVDALADRIVQRHLTPQNARRQVHKSAQTQLRKWSSAAWSRSRSVLQRKAIPTRVQITQTRQPQVHNVLRRSEGDLGRNSPLDARNDHMETYDSKLKIPFASNGDTRVLRCFRSGTQFGYRMWISNGGLRHILKRVCDALIPDRTQLASLAPGVNNATSKQPEDGKCPEQDAASYNYGDILRIEISATPQEFVQAYTTLLILWHEALAFPGHNSDQTREASGSVEVDVFRWIDFTQQYIVTMRRSKIALVQLVRGMIDCVHDGLVKLEHLAANEEYCTSVGAACIGLSFAVAILQLALTVASVRSDIGSAGPRAVGEYDEIPMEWGPERFGPEVDKCLQVIVKLLSIGSRSYDPFRLGQAEQLWVALLHIFSGGSQSASSRGRGRSKRHHGESESRGIPVDPCSNGDDVASSLVAAGAIVQFSGIWSTVWHVCKSACHTEIQCADSLWSTFAYLLPLAQISDEGIAAPRATLSWRPHLASMAEAAVEKQLVDCLKRSSGNKQLRALDEALVRQAFVRIHSTVVVHGIGFGPDSHVYITLYRYLESNSFSSLSIEPLPSLPRFFTRYCGNIRRESSPSDTCTILWLKALDVSLGEWTAQLDTLQPASKQYRHLLRNVRSAVSKMLPTRILTFDTSGSRTQLSTLANYYAVFLFFLHAMPSELVRSVRLYTQLQSLLKFKESTSPIARRVYFEAWSAAAMVIARNLRQALESSGHVGGLVEQLVGKCATTADARDYYDALVMAVGHWGESVGTVICDCLSNDQQGNKGCPGMSWNLADIAFMYLQRVLTSEALANHAPTTLILVHSVLRQPFLIDIAANNRINIGGSANGCSHEDKTCVSLNAALLERLLEVVRVWQDTVSGSSCSNNKGSIASNQANDHVERDYGKDTAALGHEDNSQAAFAVFDSTELLEVTAEVEEIERQASFAAINTEILQLVHEKYIPALRLRVISSFMSLSTNSRAVRLALVPSQQQARILVATISILAHMVSSCVDAGMRAWESFFEEHGRESLHLVPDRRGRRLVLVLFALAAVNVLRSKGQSTQRLDLALKDIWFACVCDLELLPYVHRLAAVLWFGDKTDKTATCGNECSLAVFASTPVDRQLVDSRGMFDDRNLAARMQSIEAEEARATSIEAYEDRAALAISLIDGVLQEIGSSARETTVPLYTRQVLASWVGRLVDAARTIKNESEHVRYGVVDTRNVVSALTERVMLLVRNNCAELIYSMNIPL
ncbi:hypothetical protein IW140_000050, partial [Coemansia sp. RSA 1813]